MIRCNVKDCIFTDTYTNALPHFVETEDGVIELRLHLCKTHLHLLKTALPVMTRPDVR